MSTTNPITGVTTGVPTASSSVPANMQINQTDFLQLITAQLQNQNPLQPADPTQFVSQLEGMSEVSSMQSMQSSLQASQVMSGTALLGHSVLAPGAAAQLAAGGSIDGAITAPAGASKVTVTISNAAGTPVANFNVTPQASGLTPFSWNGQTAAGAAAPGTYQVQVNATVNGTTQPVNPMVVSKVESVTLDPTTQAVDLLTDSGTVALSSVVSIL
ncbi:MAG TPA: flagellar hook capping FlgD N-terminal domain-containing protein [Steroidobacteraceae bacterium]|nr:flagellar hook capping FlgD N-terminal domain-containing protein [Steroidobacteraceae bacterium]